MVRIAILVTFFIAFLLRASIRSRYKDIMSLVESISTAFERLRH